MSCRARMWERQMLKHLLRTFSLLMLIALPTMLPSVGSADEKTASQIREEVWGLSLPLPIVAYLVRPVGTGPFPLIIMNYDLSFDRQESGFRPSVELRDAANWFAQRGYAVIAPIGPSPAEVRSICRSANSTNVTSCRLETVTIHIFWVAPLRGQPQTTGLSTI